MVAHAHRSDLSRTTLRLLYAILAVGLAHHLDHVLRADHSGWPFRNGVNGFTYSLSAYPLVAFALFGSAPLVWLRWATLALAAALTIGAHSLLETPQMQYAMWAYNRSLEPHLWQVQNLCGIKSPVLGVAAVLLSMTLNVLVVTATVAMFADGLRRRRGAIAE